MIPSATLLAGEPGGEATSFRWVEVPGASITLMYGTQPVIQYVCAAYDDATPESRFATCKVYHHVFSPDGSVRLTKGDTGGLYPHHRGLFYGFNKVTYDDGRQCDIWHCKQGAHQSPEGVVDQFANAESAGQTLAIDWHGADGEVFARERRTVVVRFRPSGGGQAHFAPKTAQSEPVPEPSGGGQAHFAPRTAQSEPVPGEPSPSPSLQGRGIEIDWSSHLETADGKAIHLDGDPQHAGFHFRAAQEVADKTAAETYYVRADGRGKPGETRNWDAASSDAAMNAECTDRPWDAMSIVVGGQRYTVLYMDAPDNPRPARYSERDYGRFGSYFVRDVTAERPLDVRYRVWVQAGEMTVDQCQAKYGEFVGER